HCGRVDDLFKVGGKWVWPSEVERALLAHEAVWECAVVGADDEDGLIKPQAFVVANIGFDPDQELALTLREYVKAELSPYKYPRWIEFVDRLPRGPSGTLLRYKLRALLKASRAQRRAETAAEKGRSSGQD
ncbi:MAG: benzoate-CoA ligase family protein, partial [Deltaproteobacteria bacterium]|nr:benzoate-CoA ligase family protein [Deltaproteobacteria bacterium]